MLARADLPRRAAALPEYDASVVWAAAVLLTLGLVMVYSASISTAESARVTGGEATYYLARHAAFVGAGLAAGLAAFQVPMRAWQRAAPWLFVAGVVLLALVLVPGIGREVNGARRWLPLGIVNLQPSELMKLAVVLYAADYTVRKHALLHSFRRGLLPMLGVMLVVGWLLLREPDFGAFVVICAVAMAILFLGGMNGALVRGARRARHDRVRAAGDLLAVPRAAHLRLHGPVGGRVRPRLPAVARADRVRPRRVARRGPRRERREAALPAGSAHRFPARGDRRGARLRRRRARGRGCSPGWSCARSRSGAAPPMLERPFNALVAQGIAVWLGVQAFINMGVNMGVLPTKGLTLPLMSFGGQRARRQLRGARDSLLRVDWESRQLMRGQPV